MPSMEQRRLNNPHQCHSWSDMLLDYSPQSVLSAMEKFSAAVNAMQQSVLVPSRLQDINDDDMGDLHAAYKLLSKTKMDILFGDNPMLTRPKKNSSSAPQSRINSRHNSSGDGMLVSEQENGVFVDPTLANLDPTMLKLHAALNQNIQSLHVILEQMTASAEKVTTSYLKEVGGSH